MLCAGDQQIKEEEEAKAAASAIPSQSSGKAAASSKTQDPLKQAKGGSYSLAKKAPPASQNLLHAVSGSDLDHSDVATESAAEKQPEVSVLFSASFSLSDRGVCETIQQLQRLLAVSCHTCTRSLARYGDHQ